MSSIKLSFWQSPDSTRIEGTRISVLLVPFSVLFNIIGSW